MLFDMINEKHICGHMTNGQFPSALRLGNINPHEHQHAKISQLRNSFAVVFLVPILDTFYPLGLQKYLRIIHPSKAYRPLFARMFPIYNLFLIVDKIIYQSRKNAHL